MVYLIFLLIFIASVLSLPFLIFISPFILTVLNTIFLFMKDKKTSIKIWAIKIHKVSLINFTILNAFFNTALYISAMYDEDLGHEIVYQYNTVLFNLKNPLEYMKFNYYYLFLIGSVALIILNTVKKNPPPVVTIILMSFIYVLNILTIFLVFQIKIYGKFEFNMIYLVPYNCIIITVMVFRKIINRQLDYIEENKIKYTNPFINKCYIFLCNSKNWRFISFALLMILFIINIAIYIITLFGQGDKSNLNNLLDVNQWLTIKEVVITPEPEPGQHYLCTVALKGDKKIVKPLRYGYRYNRKIIVNRQLLVANAFEDYIQKSLPNIHKFIRYIYDKYGYPLSKKIKTKKSANITYILMKPLEWFFVLFLYTFDTEPEKRISRQYL